MIKKKHEIPESSQAQPDDRFTSQFYVFLYWFTDK